MSKIIELAQEIEKEINDLHHRIDYLEMQNNKERENKKKFLEQLKYLIEEELANG